MALPVRFFFVLGGLLLAQSAWALLDGYRFLGFVRRRRSRPASAYTPLTAVVIPCKGLDRDLDANLERFQTQDFPSYQIVWVVATDTDPGYRQLQARLQTFLDPAAARSPRTTLLVAGIADERGEKVNNLLRGLDAVDPAVEVLVFADIDARPSRDWLRSLVGPLADPRITVSTGFRWYLPGEGFASQLRAAWDTSIATLLGEHNHNFAWGGSMAMRAADFCRLGIAERYWTNTVSDDYAVTRAVREAGGKIEFEPRCLVAAQGESSFADFIRWSNRQIIITRVYAPRLWGWGLAAHAFYALTFIWGSLVLEWPGVAASERWFAVGLLLVILSLGVGKGRIRSVVARELFSKENGYLKRLTSRYWQLTFLVPWVMLWNFLVAGFMRRIEWRGTHYELVTSDHVRVLKRDSA